MQVESIAKAVLRGELEEYIKGVITHCHNVIGCKSEDITGNSTCMYVICVLRNTMI